ncbi:MAG: hypothetical protein MR536_00350 [Prevotella sp.]|nr:hypothetical protein [Prevotella sp.]
MTGQFRLNELLKAMLSHRNTYAFASPNNSFRNVKALLSPSQTMFFDPQKTKNDEKKDHSTIPHPYFQSLSLYFIVKRSRFFEKNFKLKSLTHSLKNSPTQENLQRPQPALFFPDMYVFFILS